MKVPAIAGGNVGVFIIPSIREHQYLKFHSIAFADNLLSVIKFQIKI